MSPKSAKATRKLRGAQKWILEELRALGPTVRLSTSQIAKKITKARGKAFHQNSVYNALRILVRRGHVTVVRDGHEKLYQSTGASRAESPAPNAAPAPSPTGSASVGEVSGAMLPHKLALGEILVVSMDAHQIVTATNLHGRLVLERHPLPG